MEDLVKGSPGSWMMAGSEADQQVITTRQAFFDSSAAQFDLQGCRRSTVQLVE